MARSEEELRKEAVRRRLDRLLARALAPLGLELGRPPRGDPDAGDDDVAAGPLPRVVKEDDETGRALVERTVDMWAVGEE